MVFRAPSGFQHLFEGLGDGHENITDSLGVFAAWGAGGGPADVNDDGVVNIADLLFVIAHWG
jgi:hypothetical protein